MKAWQLRGRGREAFAVTVAIAAAAGCGGNSGESDAIASGSGASSGNSTSGSGGGVASSSSSGGGASGTSSGSSSTSSSSGGADCGLMGGMRGLTMQTVMVGAASRSYLMYLPESLSPATLAPFLYVFHGSTMSGQQMHDITQYAALADKEGIAVVFPDGNGGPGSFAPWNVAEPGQSVCGFGQFAVGNGDDFGFMDAMKAVVQTYQCIDPAHVFATGFSMGGYFSHHVGCYRSDVRAVGPHSGGGIASLSSCTTGHVPIIIFHGTADALIAPGCDDPNSPPVEGFPPSATLWAEKNGCKSTYTTVPVNGPSGDGQCYLYDDCPADGQVELCTFTGMGHCWAGGSTAGEGASNACPPYASATQLEWDFFKTYAW
jgi:polyhydroxybutyrate depolymerase